MPQLIINKTMEKAMLADATASIRKGKTGWNNVETYNVTYDYPVGWDWWKAVKKVYGREFRITTAEATNCADKRTLDCYPVTKRNTKTGEVFPILKVKQKVEINSNKPQTTLKFSDEEASALLDHVKKKIKETAEEKAQQLFDTDCENLFGMIKSYNKRRADDDKKVASINKLIRAAQKKVDDLQKKRNEVQTDLYIGYLKDVSSLLKSKKFKIPEDLKKELACGYEYDAKTTRKVCTVLNEKIKKAEAAVKNDDIKHGPYSYSYRDSVGYFLHW